jgi:hypothetical protein
MECLPGNWVSEVSNVKSLKLAMVSKLEQGHALLQLRFNFALECPGKPGLTEIKWDTSAVRLC